MKHTPGPWEVSGAGTFVKLRADNKAICRMNHGGVWEWATEKGSIEDQANAQLIAAAPKLLEACETALHALNHMTTREFGNGKDHPIRYNLKQVIAEATKEG